MTIKLRHWLICSLTLTIALACLPPSSPGTAYYVDSAQGNDAHSGALASPWKTLSNSISRLRAGDTLHVRGGVYFEHDIDVRVSGTESRRIVITNYQNESPLVDGGYREFRAAPNDDWEIHDIEKKIYRSVRTYASSGIVHGYLKSGDGYSHLVPYERYGDLSTTNETYSKISDIYVGPGVYWNSADQRIYIRLTPGRHALSLDVVPDTTDPRQLEVIIVPDGDIFHFKKSSSYVDIHGIDVKYRNNALRFDTGSHHINVRNAHVLGGRTHIFVDKHVHHLSFDAITIDDSFPPWVSWTDVKKGRKPAHSLQQAAINLKHGVHDVEIKNSLFNNIFDGIDAASKVYNIHIHHNDFRGMRDDVMQLGTASYNIEIGHNRMIHVSKGPGRNGSGNSERPGEKYIHHNIIDLTEKLLHFRAGYPHYAESGDGRVWNSAFGSHSGDESYADPWKIYNNTILVGKIKNINYISKGIGYAYNGKLHDIPQEVFNNIFIQTQDHIFERDIAVDNGSHILDGNVYYRNVSGSEPIFKNWSSDAAKKDFDSLAHFSSDGFFTLTQSHYSPGWEHSGIEADPQLDAEYRPLPGSPAAAGGVDLSLKQWPGTGGGAFRGALPARLSADTVSPALDN